MVHFSKHLMVFIMALCLAMQAAVVLSATINIDPGQYKANTPASIFRRAATKCYHGPKAYGCDQGSCWKKCDDNTGNGHWCWLELSAKYWVNCQKDTDCEPRWTGNKCSTGDCGACGCSC
ncbi:hypothetical protein HBI25_206390 [Parastagonospora nodorum]|nr:hypothetical protein HBH52_190580 [Parastagonospora nodorum]KAH4115612.1 hypothetical protein HBH47_177980 [Parastagonospora nodorum]KAH4916227.1 hypothetical protein HBI79_229220 [Parastagonospora nodorum]KAH4979782.1 hypothetical protein HBI76_190500 [Parastagonospora nodorum]KAH5078274.1 hypothetical protein HBI73_170370 [Parastagonospora nodorum]